MVITLCFGCFSEDFRVNEIVVYMKSVPKEALDFFNTKTLYHLNNHLKKYILLKKF